jgi:hypothetical protein
VRLHIERLVFDGFTMTPAERVRLLESVQAELGLLLTHNGVPGNLAGGLATPVINGGMVRQPAGVFEPVSFGRELAHTLYGSLGGGKE